jgi:heat shock protein HslJ
VRVLNRRTLQAISAAHSGSKVKSQGSDDKTLVPGDKAKYTIGFETTSPVCKGGEIAKSQRSNPHGPATTSLENKYWRLSHLGAVSVTAASQEREPHIVLNSESSRVTGSGGCKRLTGSYELKGDELKLSHMTGIQRGNSWHTLRRVT